MRISEYQHQQIARRAGNREKELDLLARDLERLLRRVIRAVDGLRTHDNWSRMNMAQECAEDFLRRKGRLSPLKKTK